MPDRTGIFWGWSANLSNFLGLGVEAGASPMYPQKMRVPPPPPGRVTRHLPSNQIHFNYSLHQQTLEQVRSAKYLGLTITDDLEWGQHISEISCKATKTLGFLRRNLALAPRHTKEVAYKTLVRPQLEYAAPIWHPYNETEKKRWRKCRRQQPGGPAGDGITRVALTICWTNSSGHLWGTTG